MIWFWANSNTETNLVVKFEPSASIPQGGKILVGFPTYDYYSATKIFDKNLGITGVTDSNA